MFLSSCEWDDAVSGWLTSQQDAGYNAVNSEGNLNQQNCFKCTHSANFALDKIGNRKYCFYFVCYLSFF